MTRLLRCLVVGLCLLWSAPAQAQVQTWTDLGRLDPEFGARAWFGTQKRSADGLWYIVGGSTNGLNSVLKWDPWHSAAGEDPPLGSWVFEKQGPVGWPASPSFPDPGSFYPNIGDNGFILWDTVHDELLVNAPERCANDGGLHCDPGIYNPTLPPLAGDPNQSGGRWRALTTAEFPDLSAAYGGITLFHRLKDLFNPASAAGPTTSVLYGGDPTGNGGGFSDLIVYVPGNAPGRQWTVFPGQGGTSSLGDASGPGLVSGSSYTAESLLRWSAALHKYVMHRSGQFWTMPEGSISGGWTWTRMVTSGSTAGMPNGASNFLIVDDAQRAVVLGGQSSDGRTYWVIDVTHAGTVADPWPITKIVGGAVGTPPPGRADGLAWNVLNDVYVDWGQEGGPADLRQVWKLSISAPLIAPTDRWLAIPHGPGSLAWNGSSNAQIKHTSHSRGGFGGRVFFHAGDFHSPGHGDSYQQTHYSLSLPAELSGPHGSGWHMEDDYCQNPPKPKHMDKGGVHWDATRGVYWIAPGSSVISNENCVGETAATGSDPLFPWNAYMVWNPSAADILLPNAVTALAGRWTLYDPVAGPGYDAGNNLSGVDSEYSEFDSTGDDILHLMANHSTFGLRIDHYHIATRTHTLYPPVNGWTVAGGVVVTDGSGNTEIHVEANHHAFDPAGRKLYMGDQLTGMFFAYDAVTHTLVRKANLPGGPTTQQDGSAAEYVFMDWDSVDGLVLYFRRYPPGVGFYTYTPSTDTWSSNLGLASTVPGETADGAVFWYDPAVNAAAIMGGTPVLSPGVPGGTRYLFVRGITGITPPPPTAPAPRTGLMAVGVP